MERWCRLRGNLLFYFKSRDVGHRDPAGLIVLDDECAVRTENDEVESTFGIVLEFAGGVLGINFVARWYTDTYDFDVQMCSSFAFAFVVGDFTLRSRLISDNKSQKAKDLHSPDDINL